MSENRGPRFPQIITYDQVPKNLLINGGFEIWQRGAGPFTSTPNMTADEWQIGTLYGTLSITQDTSNQLFGDSCIAAVYSASTAGSQIINQGIEQYKSLEGLWLTFSIWAKTSTADSVVAGINDYDGSTNETATSNIHTGSGNWEQLTVTKLIRTGLQPFAAIPHSFGMQVKLSTRLDCTVYVDGAMLVVGKFPEGVPYVPTPPAIDLLKAYRYYQSSGNAFGNGLQFMGDVTSGLTYYAASNFPVEMQATPTVTLTHNSSSNFPGAAGTTVTRQHGCGEYRVANGTGRGFYGTLWTAEVT